MLSLTKLKLSRSNAADPNLSASQRRRLDEQQSTIGLGRNDITTCYMLLASAVLAVFYFKERSDIVSNYYQYNIDPEALSENVRVVGQMGLGFFTSMPSVMGAYNVSTPKERDERERDFIRFVNACKTMAGTRSNMLFRTEVVSQSAGSQKNLAEESAKVSSDCGNSNNPNSLPNQSAWWKAKYEILSLFSDTDPEIRFLPVSFYIYGSDTAGNNVIFGGPVRAITIESDQDISNESIPHDGVAYKVQMDIVDTTWSAEAGRLGKNQEYRLVVNQQNDKCIFSVMVRDENGEEVPYNIFISRLDLRLEEEPVTLTDDMFKRFASTKTYPVAKQKISFFPSRDLTLSYALRCLPYIDGIITWHIDEEKNTVLIGTYGSRQLPLEVHIRSDDEIDDKGNKFIALPVKRVLIRYGNKPPVPGSLNPDATPIASVQFILANGEMLAQDADIKTKWIYKDIAIPAKSTVDLLFLNYTPDGVTFTREPGLNNGAKTPEVDGIVKFETFKGLRQGLQMVSISEATQQELRAQKYPNQSFDDIRVAYELEYLDTQAALVDSRFKAVAMAMGLLLLLGWKFSKRAVITRGGLAISVFALVVSIAISLIGVLEFLDNLPDQYRPYEPVVFTVTVIVVFFSMGLVLYSSRYVPELSPSFVLASFVALASAAFFFALQIDNSANLTENVQSLRLALLLVLFNSLSVLSLETEKLALKARYMPLTGDDIDENKIDSAMMVLPNSAFMFTLASVMLIAFAAGISALPKNSPFDQCDPLLLKQRRLYEELAEARAKRDDAVAADANSVNAAKYTGLYKYADEQRRAADSEVHACVNSDDSNNRFITNNATYGTNLYYWRAKSPEIFGSNNKWSDLTLLSLLLVPTAAFYAIKPRLGMFLGRVAPSRIREEVGLHHRDIKLRIEDNRVPRVQWITKTATGIAFVLFMAYLLAPQVTEMPPYCSALDNLASDNQKASGMYSLLLDTEGRATEVRDAQRRFGCYPREFLVLVTGALILVLGALISWVTPSTMRLVSTKTSALKFIGVFVYTVVAAGFVTWVVQNPKALLDF